jgi:DNA polymerase III delta prime subunit
MTALQAGGFRPGRCHHGPGDRHQAPARRFGSPEKPVGSFLFTGPTGVGKTEVARQVALSLGIEFMRYDMSEYMEKHAVARLIGAPPGYIGFDQGGLLTDGIRKHPLQRAAAGRNRKGAPGPVQHPAAGHGPRHPDGQQREKSRFPQRDPDDDLQCRQPRNEPGHHRVRRPQEGSFRKGKRPSKDISARNFATASMP